MPQGYSLQFTAFVTVQVTDVNDAPVVMDDDNLFIAAVSFESLGISDPPADITCASLWAVETLGEL